MEQLRIAPKWLASAFFFQMSWADNPCLTLLSCEAKILPMLSYKKQNHFLILALLGLVFAATQLKAQAPVEGTQTDQPFWRAKPKIFAKVTEERAIVVNVKAEKTKDHAKANVLHMQGAGLVHSDASLVFTESQKFNELKEISDHIVEVKVGPSVNDVFIHTEAFNYHARMTMRVTPETAKDGVRHLKFIVLEGNFKGMTGEFTYSEFKPLAGLSKHIKKATLLGFNADYEYDVLPMPQFFVEFGIEVVLQRVASRMRAFLEDKLKTAFVYGDFRWIAI